MVWGTKGGEKQMLNMGTVSKREEQDKHQAEEIQVQNEGTKSIKTWETRQTL